MTHWVDYSPENLGQDVVKSACGLFIPITDFSPEPTCPKCKLPAKIHWLRLRAK